MILFNPAIFNSAVFNTSSEPPTDQPSGGIDAVSWQPDFSAIEAEKEARKAFREKQDEIVELRLEAQDLLLRKRDLAEETTKQAQRQLRALEAEYQNLQLEIERQLILLEELGKISIIRRKSVLMLLLAAGSPFAPLAIN